MVHPNDPQDLNRYAYCRNNPINLVDPSGHGWLSKFFKGLAKGFASGFAGGLVTALLFPVMGPLAFAVGGAVTGAMSAALNGAGWQGILMGAAMGGLIGGVLGPLSMVNKGLAVALGAGLAIAGGVLAYQQGGIEGLAGYAGNVIGGIAGYGAGQATGKNIANGMRASPQQTQAQVKASLRTDQKPEVSSKGQQSGPKAILKTNYDIEGQPKSFDLYYENQPVPGAKVYRVFDNNINGSSWTPMDPRTVPNYSEAAGLYNKGGFLAEGTLQDTSGVMVRSALPGPNGKGGGLTEWVIPNSKVQVRVDKVHVYGLD